MKKIISAALCFLLLFVLAAARADTLNAEAEALKEARTLDEQLAAAGRIAREHASELENGGWDISLSVSREAEALPGGTVPEDWEAYGYEKAVGFPEELRDSKFIFLNSSGRLAPAWHCRLPDRMRASSAAEAEYALVVSSVLTPSGYTYIPPASSSHRDYSAYILDLKTGKATRFWFQRNSAKRSGKWGQLDGDTMSPQEIWEALRSEIWGEIRYPAADGVTLIFGVTGQNCYLKGYEGEPVHVEVPAEAEGHPVTEIGEKCFFCSDTLKSARLPEGVRIIRASAFQSCYMMEEIRLPSTLEEIGSYAFSECGSLKGVRFPDGIRRIGPSAFFGCSMLTEVSLPASLESVGAKAFMRCDRLSRVVSEYAVTLQDENLFSGDDRLVCLYLAAGAHNGEALDGIPASAAIYSPEGSWFLEWAHENGHPVASCGSPEEMPPVEYVIENGMEFLLYEGEAALTGYAGQDPSLIVPETAGGLPVVRIMHHAVYQLEHVTSLTIPAGVREITGSAIYAANQGPPMDIYIANPEISIGAGAIGRYGYSETPVTIHAPEGSTAQRYVAETTNEPLAFEPWGRGVNPDARVLRDALALAEQVQESAAAFWESCEQAEYNWLVRVPGYDIGKPEAAAVLRLTPEQFDDLALLMAGPENIARVFAAMVNIRWNLPYARAAAKTARSGQFRPVPDGSCAIAALYYPSDIVFFTLRQDGSAQAALICSGSAVIESLTPESVSGTALQYGLSGECAVYSGEEIAGLLSE